MKPDLSEFSYGYAVTEELIQGILPPITAAPFFPSLNEEGRIGGFDVGLMPGGIPLFLQFKVSDFMVRNSAREVRSGMLRTPFYRMHLRRADKSDQHHLLLDLEAAGNEVYYVAPAFHSPTELNENYMDRRVVEKSIFVPPSFIGPLPDDDEHHVAFRLPGQRWFLSEPLLIEEKLDAKHFLNRVLKRIHMHKSMRLTSEFWASLADKMLYIVKDDLVKKATSSKLDFSRFQRDMPPAKQVAYLTRSYFDSELLIVRPHG
jgi:hypothetical protein